MSGADEMLTRVLADEDATVALRAARRIRQRPAIRRGHLHGNLGAERLPWYAGSCG